MLVIASGHAPALYHLAGLMLEQRRYDEAVKLLENALQSDPAHADAHDRLAGLYEGLGRLDEAARHYTVANRLRADRL